MSVISKTMSRLRTLTYLIERPVLFRVFKSGGIISTFRHLDQKWFYDLGINTVIDIGANTGQFAITMTYLLPEVMIYSFEPIPECFQELKQRMKFFINFKAFNIGIGEANTESEFEYNSFSPSSSFLRINDIHKNIYPNTCETKNITLKLTTLDNVAEEIKVAESLMIKIDVQGYEEKVLIGGEKTIKRAKLVIVETSFERLYEHQPLFHEIYTTLVNWGFEYAGDIGQSSNPHNGKTLQIDSIFIQKIRFYKISKYLIHTE